mmetsp:Transcript_30302/g.97682  ORF Transcript_30302/g.97682 Transcript_30302/m.97682 type:complete len:210 (-) Transcript_30302:159-788(-)
MFRAVSSRPSALSCSTVRRFSSAFATRASSFFFFDPGAPGLPPSSERFGGGRTVATLTSSRTATSVSSSTADFFRRSVFFFATNKSSSLSSLLFAPPPPSLPSFTDDGVLPSPASFFGVPFVVFFVALFLLAALAAASRAGLSAPDSPIRARSFARSSSRVAVDAVGARRAVGSSASTASRSYLRRFLLFSLRPCSGARSLGFLKNFFA